MTTIREVLEDVGHDIMSGCNFDQQISEHLVFGIDDLTTVEAGVIECPLGQQESSSLIAFGEPLSAGYPEGELGGLNWVDEFSSGPQGRSDTIQVVWLLEPLVPTADPLIDSDGEPEVWFPQ